MVFSATKGVASTVIHRLADRGLIDYDAPAPGVAFDAQPLCNSINDVLRDLRAEET